MTALPHPNRVAQLNDQLRRLAFSDPAAVPGPFRILLTAGCQALSPAALSELVRKVETFNAFSDDNDPWGERDFGAVEVGGTRYFWKIDYYDRSLTAGSPDAADPAITVRVLTLMRADEY